MSYLPTTKKTPVAQLGGTRDEGLNPAPKKEQVDSIMTCSFTPVQYVKRKRALQELDLPALARGTVRDLWRAAKRTGIPTWELVQMLDLEEAK